MTRRVGPLGGLGGLAAIALLASCAAAGPNPEPEEEGREFAARELAAVSLTAEEWGDAWSLMPGEEGSGDEPVLPAQADYDPCTWATAWIPDADAFSTQTWRLYAGADEVSYGSDSIIAAAPGVELRETLASYRDAIDACGGVGVAADGAQLVFETDIGPDLGDDSYSYRALFSTPEAGQYGQGEVHLVVCGPLWIHLSYSGWEPFVDRDRLLPLLVERASELGGCTP